MRMDWWDSWPPVCTSLCDQSLARDACVHGAALGLWDPWIYLDRGIGA